MVDRAELADRGLCDLLCRRCLTDVAVHECKVGRRRKAGRGDAARGCNDVIATIQKGLDNGFADALRGAGHDDCFLGCHT